MTPEIIPHAARQGRTERLLGDGLLAAEPNGDAVTDTRRGCRTGGHPREGSLSVAEDALWVGAVERETGEELRRHAAALASVVGPAAGARPRRRRLAKLEEQRALAPH